VSFPFAVIHSIVCFFYPLLDNLVVLSLGLLLLCGGQMHKLQSPDAFRCLGSSCSKLYNTISLSLLWEEISFLYCVVWKFDSIWYITIVISWHIRNRNFVVSYILLYSVWGVYHSCNMCHNHTSKCQAWATTKRNTLSCYSRRINITLSLAIRMCVYLSSRERRGSSTQHSSTVSSGFGESFRHWIFKWWLDRRLKSPPAV
jgi:hypothetical protein